VAWQPVEPTGHACYACDLPCHSVTLGGCTLLLYQAPKPWSRRFDLMAFDLGGATETELRTSSMPSAGNPSTAVHRRRSPSCSVHSSPPGVRAGCGTFVLYSPGGPRESTDVAVLPAVHSADRACRPANDKWGRCRIRQRLRRLKLRALAGHRNAPGPLGAAWLAESAAAAADSGRSLPRSESAADCRWPIP
jgi:hypothetical protein